jgi:hypothetical protein
MQRLTASFRDPSGFLFRSEGILYRQINQTYRQNYDQLMQSGLYHQLVNEGLLIPHEEVEIEPQDSSLAYRIIRPERILFISHPYEWCFGQLREAALTTLRIQGLAMKHGMCLKDASAYNIQFHHGRAVLIDTLSFEPADFTRPWVAYRQYCQHFLAPLALMHHTEHRLGQLLRIHLDGIPLDLASRLLPARTRLSFSLLSHIHLHAKAQSRHADTAAKGDTDLTRRRITPLGFRGLIKSLGNTTRALKGQTKKSEWGDYYQDTNYTPGARDEKAEIIAAWIQKVNPTQVWDLGANTGRFSRLASDRGIDTLAFDIDANAVEANFGEMKRKEETRILPLLLDLTNPSPALGWANQERDNLEQRGPCDLLMALALVHHLAISNNLPLAMIADYFSRLCRHLIIEYVPKEDSQVQRLLASRPDIFPDYTRGGFEAAYNTRFRLVEQRNLAESRRTLYLFEKR